MGVEQGNNGQALLQIRIAHGDFAGHHKSSVGKTALVSLAQTHHGVAHGYAQLPRQSRAQPNASGRAVAHAALFARRVNPNQLGSTPALCTAEPGKTRNARRGLAHLIVGFYGRQPLRILRQGRVQRLQGPIPFCRNLRIAQNIAHQGLNHVAVHAQLQRAHDHRKKQRKRYGRNGNGASTPVATQIAPRQPQRQARGRLWRLVKSAH